MTSETTALKPGELDWTADDNVGPIYRKRTPTVADYDEVIADLQAARNDLAARDWSKGCSVCGDSGCASNICHHNALVAARAWVRERGKHRCYHCGFVALTDEQAQEHFGRSEAEAAKCIQEALRAQPSPEQTEPSATHSEMLGLLRSPTHDPDNRSRAER